MSGTALRTFPAADTVFFLEDRIGFQYFCSGEEEGFSQEFRKAVGKVKRFCIGHAEA